jgi:NAD(P)-dependent dehydrogenase (short-subunit alcohol dehydrogenase family)
MRSKQAPIHSGYGELTTAREALAGRDLTGAFAVVTGGHAGIGLPTTRALAEAGATVMVGARAVKPAGAALAGIARRGRPSRSPRSRVDRRVWRALRGLRPTAAHAGEQRRDHGASAGA